MRRREFLGVLVGATAVWPLEAQAQQQAMPVIGYFYSGEPEPSAIFLAAFRKGLSEAVHITTYSAFFTPDEAGASVKISQCEIRRICEPGAA